MKEIWKDIEGYEGRYQVSNFGNVKSLNYKHTGEEKIMQSCKDKIGYLHIKLFMNGKPKMYKVHRLVAQAFIPNPNNYPQVNHKDENKTNNHVSNLEFCTPKYNNNYGTHNEKFNCIKIASEKYNANQSQIIKCCKGKAKSAGKHPITNEKLVWEYYPK